ILASRGAMRPGWVFVAASLGNLGADIGWYTLGYLGRFEVLAKQIGWLRQHRARIAHLERELRQHAVRILLLAKLTLSMVIPTLIAAGMARVPWQRWLPTLVLGEFLWTGILVVGGYYLGESIKRLEQGLQFLAVGGAILLIGGLIWFLRQSRVPSPPHRKKNSFKM
ncbi:MAG: VTT domain-containing protein, partial [Chloroflexota bacterium]